ncbi:class I SAM-dependent methyltransferase [Planctomyces sp. SH-PL14]|uniref:class I SAM-dependent methyltransferase n=1 Tax=Planctomyces sp. SH-PL14 TaxID=1632864 RepID=UPI00078D8E9E|nr:class I SAM-dependent methyltransferase [Planctomyces sp. SH-PL14]AMV20351.1 Cyclopropane-fatty-acyl-phospholipid synthase [Planctomyces sp. SH-PL14]
MPSARQRQTDAIKTLLQHLAEKLNAAISVKLWDGSVVPMGAQADPELCVVLKSPGVIASLLRRPTADNLLRHYARRHIDFEGADVHTFLTKLRTKNSRDRTKKVSKGLVFKSILPFVFAKGESTELGHGFQGDEIGRSRKQEDNRDFIQFHYDVSNDFYKLFLDPEMVYSCAYFRDWNNSLEQAQQDKLDMICRKLRLQPGERFLDIGCGWGGLICHAARHYGVIAHGITLADEQLKYTQEKIQREGLTGRVTAEIRDYAHLDRQFDKIASIGMVEHVGIDNMQLYMDTVGKLLPDRGMFLCHGITRRAKRTAKHFRKVSPEKRILAKYIFPGGELDHLGHMVEKMEAAGFEVHDVEGWRDHYAMTCKHWAQRLEARKDEAIQFIGEERYRIWLLYLAGVGLALGDGSACIFQTVGTKHISRGHSTMPPTREHLYRPKGDAAPQKRVA